MDRLFILFGSLSAFLGVGLGAFGAHALRSRLSTDLLAIFEIGVRYQMYHALGLLAVGFAYARWPSVFVIAAGWAFVAGTILFSGSLYALAFTGVRGWGAVTPFGGLAFLAGWLCLAWGCWRQ